MKINEIKRIVVTATKDDLNNYLLNPPYWDRHMLTQETPNIEDILEDIFCERAIKKILSKEYPQSDFNGKIDRKYRYSATRNGLSNWKWAVSVNITNDDNSRTAYELNSGDFSVEFNLTSGESGVSLHSE